MHELGIAKNIIEIVCNEIKNLKEGSKIDKVFFKASVVHSIYPQSLVFYFDALKAEHPFLAEASLDVEVLPVKGYCRNCDTNCDTMEVYGLCKKCNLPIEVENLEDMTVDSISLLEE
jgi:Zn finger protein HypA/HybF involved in hydrogenase expression